MVKWYQIDRREWWVKYWDEAFLITTVTVGIIVLLYSLGVI